jgi:hypothetical protein
MMREHDIEPIRGLPQRLPTGETMAWQGKPQWETLAVRAFHIRKLAIYFAVLVTWYAVTVIQAQEGLEQAAIDISRAGGLALVAIGLVGLFAWLTARATVYTITSRRIVVRFGIALSMTVNIPFSKIESASVKVNSDGTGDILLSLSSTEKMSYIILWPHVRPWRMGRVQPLLRAIPEGVSVAQLLGRTVAAGAKNTVAIGALTRPVSDVIEPRPQVAAAA